MEVCAHVPRRILAADVSVSAPGFLLPASGLRCGMHLHALRRCREGVLGLVLTVLVAMAMSGYACVFDRKYGYFAMSDVSTYNNYIRCLYSGILDEQFYLPRCGPT